MLPHQPGCGRPGCCALGLFLYDHLGGRKLLPATRGVDLTRDPARRAAQARLDQRGFGYSDCWVDDARLVVLNALDAAERGAEIRTRTRCMSAQRGANGAGARHREWRDGGARGRSGRRGLVNAAGPWVASVLAAALRGNAAGHGAPGQGHPHRRAASCSTARQAYILQNADRRIVFAIPYEGEFTLIGTTDRDYDGDPGQRRDHALRRSTISARSSIDYFARDGRRRPTWSGPIPACGRSMTTAVGERLGRDARLCARARRRPARRRLLSVFGGKITTYRRLAEHALEKLAPHCPPAAAAWTATRRCPAAIFPMPISRRFLAGLHGRRPWLPAPTWRAGWPAPTARAPRPARRRAGHGRSRAAISAAT